MESGLLNAFHDDQYENGSTYMKYELDNNYWSNENNSTLGIQLSETLNGILPITPNEEKLQYFNDEDDELNFQYSVQVGHTNINNTHTYDNETFSIIDENIHSSSSLIEVIPIDPNQEYCYSPLNLQLNNDFENDNDDDNDSISISSKTSGLTFRSRTDSSSIGDYESHSSDENSDYCDMIVNQPIHCDEINDINAKAFVKQQHDKHEVNEKIEKVNLKNLVDKKYIKNSNYLLSHSFLSDDSDIDIETISENKIQEIIGTASNKNNDIKESISLPKKYSTRSSQKTQIQVTKEIVPKKSVCDKKLINNCKEKIPEKISTTKNKKSPLKILNKKLVQAGLRGTNITAIKAKNKINENKNLICQNNNNNKVQNKLDVKEEITNNKEDIKIAENNLDTKVNNVESNTDISIEIKQPIKRKLNLEEYKRRRNGISGSTLCHDTNSSDSISSFITNSTNSSTATIASTINVQELQPLETNTPNIILNNNLQQKQILIQKNIMPPNPNSLLKKSFYYMAATQEKPMDPITEAKNKVLRMQELKRRAVQKRLIDITVSAKIGPVTKILPLEEIVKNSNNHINTNQVKLNSEYEEIIIVSIGCNTDLHIPPMNKTSSDGTKSTSALLVISDTLQKVKTSSEQFKISNQSLITSIQNVVFQKSVVGNCIIENPSISTENTKEKLEENIEHGEDKIIMHLRKDRVRARKFPISTQTDFSPEFPPLELFIKEYSNNLTKKERVSRRKYRLQKNSFSENDSENYADHNYCSNSTNKSSTIVKGSDSESDLDDSSRKSNYEGKSKHRSRRQSSSSEFSDYNSKRSWSRSKSRRMGARSRRNSYSRSRSRSRSISRSKTRSRSRSRSYSRRNASRNQGKKINRKNSPAVEERRIVYVGRIEDETTRDDLRKKFIAYGAIKQITLHYKDTGMKYGFVTYDKAGDAFKAIDNSSNDENIKMYDISFGGRRGFCRSIYSDLDGAATNYYQDYSYGNIYQDQYDTTKNDEDDSFEALLQKVKKKIVNTKQNQQMENSNNNHRNKNNK